MKVTNDLATLHPHRRFPIALTFGRSLTNDPRRGFLLTDVS